MEKLKVPKRLYKYRSINSRSLASLVADKLFFADPSEFNDPLDSRPSLEVDLDLDSLVSLFRNLFLRRVGLELREAAIKLSADGPNTRSRIITLAEGQADAAIANIRYCATYPDLESSDPERFLFGQHAEDELLKSYDRGAVSLAASSLCPLMWSHYGDQHKGICLGYSVPSSIVSNLHKIVYGGSRCVKASVVAAMLSGDGAARRIVDAAIFMRKAKAWSYEREWRLIGPRGIQASMLELEEVVFGMRCSNEDKYIIVRSLIERRNSIRFYEIVPQTGSFVLRRFEIIPKELLVSYPKRALDVDDWFSSIHIDP